MFFRSVIGKYSVFFVVVEDLLDLIFKEFVEDEDFVRFSGFVCF